MSVRTDFSEPLSSVWERLAGSLWFLPGCIVLVLVGAAIGLVELSMLLDEAAVANFPRVFEATPESARNMLSTIAGSVITVAGVTFSIMVVAVSQASSQYTPRVLRNFMRDRSSQLTLGILVGVFLYCLVVLRTIRSEELSSFVPAIAVSVALLLAFIAVAMLMYFIHHIASTLEAGSIIANISEELTTALDRLFPEELGEEQEAGDPDERLPEGIGAWRTVRSPQTGYIQHVDAEGLLRLAAEHDAVIRMERGVGDFIAATQPLASIASVPDSRRIDAELPNFYHFASFRTVYQDAAFGIRQIVDIALKALSPSVNDVTTAVTCMQYLTAVMLRTASRPFRGRLRMHRGELRLIVREPSFQDLLDLCFDEIRRESSRNARMLVSIATGLEMIFERARRGGREVAVRRHALRVQSAMQCDRQLAMECADGVAACGRVLNAGAP